MEDWLGRELLERTTGSWRGRSEGLKSVVGYIEINLKVMGIMTVEFGWMWWSSVNVE
jgi:hypothetical protein